MKDNKTKIEDEPAFPNEYDLGMTLRDYFAGQALQGMYAKLGNTVTGDVRAKNCYEMADAMLKERIK